MRFKPYSDIGCGLLLSIKKNTLLFLVTPTCQTEVGQSHIAAE